MALNRLTLLDRALKAAVGSAYVGYSDNGPPYPAGLTLQFSASATQEQIDAANAIKDGWDYRPRVDLSPAQIAAQVAALTLAQEVALRRRLFARVLLAFADDAADIITTLNLPVATEEVAPNP